MADEGSIELEHALGYSGDIPNSLHLHPNRTNYLYITGACIVVGDLRDPHEQYFLRGHDDSVTCLAVAPSGRLVASGQRGYNADAVVWLFAERRELYRLSEHDYEVTCMDFSHDDRLLVTCGNANDKKMFIWDMLNGYIVTSVPLTPSPTVCVKFGGYRKDIKGRPIDRYQMVTGGPKKLVMWSLNPYSGEFETEALTTGTLYRDFTSLDFSPNGEKHFVAGTTSGDFLVFLMKNHHMFCTQAASSQGITSLKMLSESLVMVGGGDGSLSLYQVEGGRAMEQNRIQLAGALTSLSVSTDFAEALAGSQLGLHYRIRTSDFANALLSEHHTKPVTYVNFPKGISDKFATGSEDGSIKIWDGSDYSVISRCVVSKVGAVTCFVLTLEIVVSGWEDGKIRAFRADNGQLLWFIDSAHVHGVTCLILSNNQRFFCSGGMDGEVRVWEIRTKEMISNLKEHTSKVTQLQLFTNDYHLVSASRDKSMLTWDLRSEKRIAAHAQRIGGINTLGLAGNQNLIVTAGQERKLCKWDLRQTTPLVAAEASPHPSGDEITTLEISHDGRFIATGGEKLVVRIWDFESLQMIAEGHGHSALINKVAWSYDDKQVISVGKDNCVFTWNVYLQ